MTYERAAKNSVKELNTLNKNKLIVKAKYGPSKPTTIPLIIDEKLSCFVAAIIGDGHLNKNKFQITLDGFNKELIIRFKKVSNRLFERDFNVTTKMEKGKERYCLIMESKAIHNLLNKVFKIPAGKKSNIVTIPNYIKKDNNSIKSAFIIGILATEGGRRRRGFGLSTASEKLLKDLKELFEDLNVIVKTDKWLYKKYNKTYYGLYFKKEELNKIISKCLDEEISKLIESCPNFN